MTTLSSASGGSSLSSSATVFDSSSTDSSILAGLNEGRGPARFERISICSADDEEHVDNRELSDLSDKFDGGRLCSTAVAMAAVWVGNEGGASVALALSSSAFSPSASS